MKNNNISLADLRPGDILIFILAIAFVVFLFKHYWFSNPNSVEFVSIQVNNQPSKIYPALTHQRINIITNKGKSEIEIKNGRVRFTHSTCHSQQCILHGWIDKAGETLVCLPNQISIQLVGRKSEFDALSF
jgi:hypothetical protein